MINKLLLNGMHLGKSTTAKHIYWVFSGNVLSTILTFFTLVLLISPRISKEEYGIFLALFTLATLLTDLGEAGLGGALAKYIPPLTVSGKENEAKKYLATAFKLNMGIALIIGVLMCIFASSISGFLFEGTKVFNVLITAFMTITMITMTFSTFALAAYNKFPEVTVVNVFYSLVRLGMLVLMIFVNQLTLPVILVIYLLSALFAWGYTFVYLGIDFIKLPLNWNYAKDLGRFARFLAVQKIFIAISSRLDLLMLIPLAGAIEAGIYGMASRFALVYPLVISSVGQVFSPKFAEFKGGKEATVFFRKAGLVTSALLISLVFFYIFASFFIRTFVKEYIEAIPVLKGLLIAMAPFIAATPFVSLLTYTLKKPNIVAFASLVQLIVIFIANLLFIPTLKRLGPAAGIGVGNAVALLIIVTGSWYYIAQEK